MMAKKKRPLLKVFSNILDCFDQSSRINKAMEAKRDRNCNKLFKNYIKDNIDTQWLLLHMFSFNTFFTIQIFKFLIKLCFKSNLFANLINEGQRK